MKVMNYRLLILMVVATGSVWAQQSPAKTDLSQAGEVRLQTAVNLARGTLIDPALGIAGPVVKNAPYTAQGSRETTQTLADGTHIVNKSTYTIYRDSSGRIRRESGSQVWISDPVANATYILDTSAHTVMPEPLGIQRIVSDEQGRGPSGPILKNKLYFFIDSSGGKGDTIVLRQTGPDDGSSAESLGSQTVGGVYATGTKLTMTIATGAIGNDRPIKTITETWYSPDLQIDVLTRQTDPRTGETASELNITSRADPDPLLFQIPAGYRTLPAPKLPPLP